MNFDNLVETSKKKRERGLPKLSKPNKVVYTNFELVKMVKCSFKRKFYSSDDILKLIHINLCVPVGV